MQIYVRCAVSVMLSLSRDIPSY